MQHACLLGSDLRSIVLNLTSQGKPEMCTANLFPQNLWRGCVATAFSDGPRHCQQ